jgi:hypothetical protein
MKSTESGLDKQYDYRKGLEDRSKNLGEMGEVVGLSDAMCICAIVEGRSAQAVQEALAKQKAQIVERLEGLKIQQGGLYSSSSGVASGNQALDDAISAVEGIK